MPTVGVAATYHAVLCPPVTALRRSSGTSTEIQASSRPRAPRVAHVYLTPGEKQVTMRVFEEGKGKGGKIDAVVTKTIHVNPLVATPHTDPSPVTPSPQPDAPGTVDEAKPR